MTFDGVGLNDADVGTLAASSHFNALWLDLSGNDLSIKAFEALAQNSATRDLLVVARFQAGMHSGPCSETYWPGQLRVLHIPPPTMRVKGRPVPTWAEQKKRWPPHL